MDGRFAIESIVQNLELTLVDWPAIPTIGTFTHPGHRWEHV
jgi:hypothetical protein